MSKTEAPPSPALRPNITACLQAIPKRSRYLIALSGGLDSVALLYFSHSLLKSRSTDCRVIHVHHGLSPHADHWSDFCRQLCQQLNLPFIIEYVRPQLQGQGLEAAARQARYQAFAKHMLADTLLLQGHHLNDQAETLLMRMLKGLPLEALTAIPQQRAFAGGAIFRPWLDVSRAELKAAVEQSRLSWIEDESNADQRFERNRMRHQVLPYLQRAWPKVLDDLGLLAKHLLQLASIRQRLAAAMLQQCESERHQGALEVSRLMRLSVSAQQLLLREWLGGLGLSQPPAKIFQRIWSELLPAAADAQPIVQWQQEQLRRYDGCLFYVPFDEHAIEPYVHRLVSPREKGDPPNFKGQLEIAGRQLRITCATKGELLHQFPEPLNSVYVREETAELEVKSWQAGEVLQCVGDRHSRSLARLFQARKIPPWRRKSVPCLYINGELSWVAGLGCAQSFALNSDGEPQHTAPKDGTLITLQYS